MKQFQLELYEYLRRLQNEDGSFGLCPEDDSSDDSERAFISSMILCLLDGTRDIRDRLSDFVANEWTERWSVRSWERRSEDGGLPGRLDVTCTAVAGLTLSGNGVLTPDALVKIIINITEAETEEGGPYKAWTSNEKDVSGTPNDADPAVNAWVAFFLGLHDIRLEKTDAFLKNCAELASFYSSFYPSEDVVIYLIARALQNEDQMSPLRSAILRSQKEDGGWGNPLNTALAVSSLIRLGEAGDPVRRGVDHLLRSGVDVVARSYPFFSSRDQKRTCGHASLTIAHCLEALRLFEKASECKKDAVASKVEPEVPEVPMSALLIRSRITHLPAPLAQSTERFLDDLLAKDRDGQIFSLPAMFHASMRQKTVSQETVDRFCIGSVYGWMAYTIFDDLMDGDGGAERLPVAAFCMRELSTIYESCRPSVRALFHHTMDLVDGANAWELAHCRFPVADGRMHLPNVPPDDMDGRGLAERSLGHALGAIAIMLLSGYGLRSREISAVKRYFVHTIIARQLCDDLEDWESDLRRGQLNGVSIELLRKYEHAVEPDGIPIEACLSDLRLLFWKEVLPDICANISRHADAAINAITSVRSILHPDLLIRCVTRYQEVADHALKQRDERLAAIEVLEDPRN